MCQGNFRQNKQIIICHFVFMSQLISLTVSFVCLYIIACNKNVVRNLNCKHHIHHEYTASYVCK